MTHPDPEGRIEGVRETSLFRRIWSPAAEPLGTVAIAHGFGEHTGRWAHVGERLARAGYLVAAADHRGHGLSGGRRGHLEAWSDYLDDLDRVFAVARSAAPGVPVYLYGHSMGGVIALDYAMERPDGLTGVIASAPAMRPLEPAKSVQILLARLLSRLWPTFSMKIRLETSALSRDPKVVRAYEADPLVHERATARWGVEFLAAAARVAAGGTRIEMPILMIHGLADRVASAAATRELFDSIPGSLKRARFDPQGFHEPHNDLDRDAVIDAVLGFLSDPSASQPESGPR